MKKLYLFIAWLVFGFCQTAFAQSNAEEMQVEPLITAQHKVVNGKSMSEDEKISYLINYLRTMADVIFIRNGDEYSPGKAADHLQSKWNKHKKKVKTAHDFVERLASFSKTKEPYQIKFQDGHTITCGEFLNQELAKIEQ
jgi:hypothetical protein